MKKILIFIALLTLILPAISLAKTDNPVNLYLFWRIGCPHCAAEEKFLEGLKIRFPNLSIHRYEVSENMDNQKILMQAGEKVGAQIGGVPFTVIGDQYQVGYLDDASSGDNIESLVYNCSNKICPDPIGEMVGLVSSTPKNTTAVPDSYKNLPETVNFPLLGQIKLKNLSLPILTIVIGLMDGFNPCAMWTLVFLISLLIGMGDRKRMWILGSAFIFGSGLVYFLFMTAWLNTFLFLGYIYWIRFIVAFVALAAGAFNVREYFQNKDLACEVGDPEKKKKIFDKIKTAVQKESFIIALGGIMALAFVINLIELVCSAGFPAVYTQVLTLSHLPIWQYYAYLLLYIILYMFDDMVVFAIAMVTLKITNSTNKYTRFSKIVGGIAMLIIGLLMLFKPAWLMFG